MPCPPYYEYYYEQGVEGWVDWPMDIKMLFHPKDNNMVDYFPTSNVVVDGSLREEEGEVLNEYIFITNDQPLNLTHI